MKLKIGVLLMSIVFLFSCSKSEDNAALPIEKKLQAGVAITFDDNYVDEWYNADKLLERYNWKATFFISQFNTLPVSQLNKLKILKSKGNEIGGHGWMHVKAAPYQTKNGDIQYLNKEIFPMMQSMNENAMPIHSFAYPYGSRDAKTDTLLLKEFNIIRATTYGKVAPNQQKCYFNYNRVLYGLGIDNSYPQYSIPYFLSLLEYAKKNNRVVIFYAHKPVYKSDAQYETEYKTLIAICKYIKSNDMKFYTISDLYSKERNKK